MALNLAVGVQCASYQIPVHRNSLKPKATTMASYVAKNPNPASKYGALQLPSPTTTQRNLVTSRRGKRITVAAALQGINVATATTISIELKNQIGRDFYYKASYFWKGGSENNIPQTITKSPVEFNLDADEDDGTSVVGLAYTVKGWVDWVLAWKYKPGSEDNKMYTKILPPSTEYSDEFFANLYDELMQQRYPKSTDEDPDRGYFAEAELSVAKDNSATVKAHITYT